MRRPILLGLALCAALACDDSTTTASVNGGTKVLLTDGPFPYDRIARVDVHIVRVQVAASADTSDPNQAWTTIVEPNRTINLLELQAGKTTLLGESAVEASAVGAVRLVINSALSSVTDNAGNAVSVHWPVQGEFAIHAYKQGSLAIYAEGTPNNLIIDFDVGRSFEDVFGDGSLVFIPWIRALEEAGTGSVTGVVRGPGGPLPNVAVTVLSGDPNASPWTWWKVATGKTDAEGRYKVAFVYGGTYIVRAEPLVATVGCADSINVVVEGPSTTVNFDLPAPPGTCAQRTGIGGGPDTTGAKPGAPVPPAAPPQPGADSSGTEPATPPGPPPPSPEMTGVPWPSDPRAVDAAWIAR